jgi:rubrerythrin
MYNALELYEIGIQIEKNGKNFYEEAAAHAESPDVKKFLKELAEWENQHISLFQTLKEKFQQTGAVPGSVDPDNEAQKYLRAAAESHVFRKSIDVSSLVQGCSSPVDVLNIAMQFEKDSVVLYNTMQEVVPVELGKDQVQRLLSEELKHISMLHEKMLSLGK